MDTVPELYNTVLWIKTVLLHDNVLYKSAQKQSVAYLHPDAAGKRESGCDDCLKNEMHENMRQLTFLQFWPELHITWGMHYVYCTKCTYTVVVYQRRSEKFQKGGP